MALAAAPAAAFERVGLVLLHGKTGSPAQFAGMAEMLDETGYGVETPEMCWSARRIYDQPLEQCFADIDAAIARLRADGFEAIVVGGHSLGGLVALAYGASHDGLAGIVALAPDGEPGDFSRHAKVAASVKRAAAMVQAGHGDDTVGLHRPRARPVLHREGDAARLPLLPRTGQRAAPGSPSPGHPRPYLLGGRHEGFEPARRQGALCARHRQNDLNTFVSVNAGHMGTPGAALVPMLDWLDRIADN